MKLFEDVRNYIGENNFRIIVYKDKIDIINYDKLEEISNDEIIVYSNKKISIKGKNLKVNKLLNNELLVLGDLIKIEFN